MMHLQLSRSLESGCLSSIAAMKLFEVESILQVFVICLPRRRGVHELVCVIEAKKIEETETGRKIS